MGIFSLAGSCFEVGKEKPSGWAPGTREGVLLVWVSSGLCLRSVNSGSAPALLARCELPGPEVTRRAGGSRCPSLEVLKPHVGSGAAGCGGVGGRCGRSPRQGSLFAQRLEKKKSFSISLSSPRPTPASGTRTL